MRTWRMQRTGKGLKMLDHYSFSSLSTLAKCARAFKYSYVDRLEPLRESVNLKAGSAMHRALHVLYSDDPKRWCVPHAVEIMREEMQGFDVPETSHLHPNFLETVIKKYADENEARDESFKPLTVWGEREQVMPFGQTVIVIVPDLIGENAHGQVELRDHKTTSSTRSFPSLGKNNGMSYQGPLYMSVLRKLGLEVDAFSINGIYIGQRSGKHYPGLSAVYPIVDMWDASRGIEVFEWAEDLIAEHTWRVETGHWPQTDTAWVRTMICGYCDYKNVCAVPMQERPAKIAGRFREKRER